MGASWDISPSLGKPHMAFCCINTARNGRKSSFVETGTLSAELFSSPPHAVHEIEDGEVTMFTLDATERSRITVALVTLVATAAASLACVAAAVGPALS
jgi:hypothetical protein